MARDNFTEATKINLYSRVRGYCSNPNCRKPTIGAHSTDESKTLKIGKAAHITAASEGGPRYNPSLEIWERKDIKNGIWLCNDCAQKIDDEWEDYPVEILSQWKDSTETFVRKELDTGKIIKIDVPNVNADLIPDLRSRKNRGLSEENKEIYGDPAPAGSDFICFYLLGWMYKLKIYNQSDVPIFNVSLEMVESNGLEVRTSLEKINSIDRLLDVTLDAEYHLIRKMKYSESEKVLNCNIPSELEGCRFDITYFDSSRNQYRTMFIIKDEEVIILEN